MTPRVYLQTQNAHGSWVTPSDATGARLEFDLTNATLRQLKARPANARLVDVATGATVVTKKSVDQFRFDAPPVRTAPRPRPVIRLKPGIPPASASSTAPRMLAAGGAPSSRPETVPLHHPNPRRDVPMKTLTEARQRLTMSGMRLTRRDREYRVAYAELPYAKAEPSGATGLQENCTSVASRHNIVSKLCHVA
jgi:hypothetical protein